MRMHVSSRVLFRVTTAVVMSILGIGAVGTQAMAWANAPAAHTKPLTASQTGAITGLIPGGAAQAVNYTIANPNDAAAMLRGVAMSITRVSYVAAAGTGSGTTWASHPAGGAAPGCAASNFTLAAPAVPAQKVAPGKTSFAQLTTSKRASIAMVNTRANQDNCKGVQITLAISAE
jgi:hypothetical protein